MRRRRHHRPKPKAAPSKRFRVNEQIQALVVKLIDADGEMRDALPIAEALEIAREAGLDLVEVSPQAVPPVCRIVDYGKLQYKQAKQEQEAKTKQKKVDTKGIRLGLRTRIAAAGITDGALLKAVRFFRDGIRTECLVMTTQPHQVRFIDTIHAEDRPDTVIRF